MKTLALFAALLLCLQSPKGCKQPPPPPPPDEKIVFQSNFESGDFSKFDYLWNPCCIAINSDRRFVHSGSKSVQFHYEIGKEGEAHQDSNLFVEKDFPNGLTHYKVSGYVYIKHPEPGGTTGIQRKLFYLKDPQGPQGTPPYYWAVILTLDTMTPRIYLVKVDKNVYGPNPSLTDLKFDTWHLVEMEVKTNTPGKTDGVIRLWIDGKLNIESTTENMRGELTTGTTVIEIGRQADRGNNLPVDEYRYWSEIKISDLN